MGSGDDNTTTDEAPDGSTDRGNAETLAAGQLHESGAGISSLHLQSNELRRLNAAIAEPASGEWFGRYRVDDPEKDKLGEGGMGIVYRAYDGGLQRVVALKRIRGLPDDRSRARFEREMRIAASLKHDNIVRVYDANVEGGVPFFVMDLINGQPLHLYLKNKESDVRPLLEIMRDVCCAVHYAHQPPFRLIHRDIKPHNILVTETGVPYVTDFGLAKATEKAAGDATLTIESFAGTPAYSSFEQAKGITDVRSDVYALGATLYHGLAGRPPYVDKDAGAVLGRLLLREPCTPLRKLRKDIPRSVRIICEKAMAAEPDQRYATAEEFADDINRFLHDEPIHAVPVRWWDRLRLRIRRRPIESSLVACVCLVSIIGAGFAIKFGLNSRAVALDRALRQDLLIVQKPGETVQAGGFLRLFDRAEAIGHYSHDLSEAARREVAKAMADAIEAGIKSPRWDETTSQTLTGCASVLERYDPDRAKQLIAEIEVRRDAWNQIGSVSAPYTDADSVLTGAALRSSSAGLQFGSPTDVAILHTVKASARDVQLLLSIGPEWERLPSLPSIYLDSAAAEKKGNWVDLQALPAGMSPPGPKMAPVFFADERARGGTLRVRIMSGAMTLAEFKLDSGKLKPGSLSISVTRDDRLAVQVNDVLPLVAIDPNPPARVEPMPVSLSVAGSTDIVSFVQRERITQSSDSPLAEADSSFSAGHFQKALDEYAAVERDNPNGLFALEAEYDQGLCNVRLNQQDRAEQNWRRIVNAGDDHWSILATIELMCLIAERDSTQNLQEFDQLSGQLALRDPKLVRDLFTRDAYSRLFNILDDNSHRVSGIHTNYDASWPEHVDKLVSLDRLVYGDIDPETAWAHLESYEAGYGPEKALPIAKELMSRPNEYVMQTPWQWSVRTYGRLMRYAGRAAAEEALRVINHHLLDEKGGVLPELSFLLVERARLELMLGHTKDAQSDLRQYLTDTPFDGFHVQAYLLQGQLYANQGDSAAAQAAWHQCIEAFDWSLLDKHDIPTEEAITLSMAAARSGELDDHRASGLMECILASEGSRADTRLYRFVFGDSVRGRGIRAIWSDDNPRGQDLIREFEFANRPYQDRMRLMNAAICYAVIKVQGFDKVASADEQSVLLALVDKVAADLNSGKLPLNMLFQYWNACGGSDIGLETLRPYLDTDERATMLYIQGRRSEVLGMQSAVAVRDARLADAARLFKAAIETASSGSPVSALATRQLEHLSGEK